MSAAAQVLTAEHASFASQVEALLGSTSVLSAVRFVLSRELHGVWQHLSGAGKQRVRALRRAEAIGSADALFLMDVLNDGLVAHDMQMEADAAAAAAGGVAGAQQLQQQLVPSFALPLTHGASAVLYAALAEYFFTGEAGAGRGSSEASDEASSELDDTLIRLGRRWRAADSDAHSDPTRTGLLQLITFLEQADPTSAVPVRFLRSELDTLEALVYREHAGLWALYQEYADEQAQAEAAPPSARDAALKRLLHGLQRVLAAQYREDAVRHSTVAVHYLREMLLQHKTTPTQHSHLMKLLEAGNETLLAAFGKHLTRIQPFSSLLFVRLICFVMVCSGVRREWRCERVARHSAASRQHLAVIHCV